MKTEINKQKYEETLMERNANRIEPNNTIMIQVRNRVNSFNLINLNTSPLYLLFA